jgi:hypothetical protein
VDPVHHADMQDLWPMKVIIGMDNLCNQTLLRYQDKSVEDVIENLYPAIVCTSVAETFETLAEYIAPFETKYPVKFVYANHVLETCKELVFEMEMNLCMFTATKLRAGIVTL